MHTILLMIAYLLLCILHLAACIKQNRAVRSITKPFLMLALAFLYLDMAQDPRLSIFLAILFGLIGDIFLLFAERPILMKAGMLAFGLGHICYTASFVRDITIISPLVLAAAVIGYALIIIVLYHRFNKFLSRAILVPGAAYLLLLIVMSISALLRFACIPSPNSFLVAAGSWLFLLSDMLLTSLLFKPDTKQGNFSVMLTYILAQTLLAAGLAGVFL